MRRLDTKTLTATVEKDAVVETIRKALRATQTAKEEAYGDVRTSSTICTDHLDSAVKHLEDAVKWMSEYRKEVVEDERRSISVAKPSAKAERRMPHLR
jgi:hypothetical protein